MTTPPAGEERRKITVPAEGEGQRLDLFLAGSGVVLSRTFGAKLIREGKVLVNGKKTRPGTRLRATDRITVEIPPVEPSSLEAEPIDLDIRYEDEHLIVVNKPAGLVVHPGTGVPGGTLVNALLHHGSLPGQGGGTERPGIVHRLDRDTSGLLVVAKTRESLARLGEAIRRREVSRRYVAVVWGSIDDRGVVDGPIGRSRRDRTLMAVTPGGKSARTRFELREAYRFASLVDVALDTGRTHQIRVHFSSLNHPVFGDEAYGGREKMLGGIAPQRRLSARRALGLLSRQALHAAALGFIHPATGKKLAFRSEIPTDMEALIEFLRADLAGGDGA